MSTDYMNWISVKDELPENDDQVLVYNEKDGISLGEYSVDSVSEYSCGWQTYYSWAPSESVSYWMPLPKFPK